MKSIHKIRLKGGFYTNQIDIALSESDDHRLSLIYGSNGTGKSSISSAIHEYKNKPNFDDIETFEVISLLDKSNNELLHTVDDREKMWVYNEDYLQSNITWNEDYLGSIIMFGEQTKIDDELKETNFKIEELKRKIELIAIEKYDASKGPYSLKEAKKVVFDTLRTNWATRDKDIRGMNRNTSVNDKTLNDIVSLKKPLQSLVQLRSEFTLRYEEYKIIDSQTEKIDEILIPKIDFNKDRKIVDLLGTKIEKPLGSEIEEQLYALIESEQNNYIHESFRYFSEQNESVCPFCLQDLNSEYKNKLIKSIKNVLNKDVNDHIKNLNALRVNHLDFNLDYLLEFDSTRVKKIYEVLNDYNDVVAKLNDLLTKKEKNVFNPIVIKNNMLNELFDQLQHEIILLNKKISDFNAKVEAIERLKFNLIEINKKMAYHEIYDFYSTYKSLEDNKLSEEKNLFEYNESLNKFYRLVQDLNAKKFNVDIALGDINRNLYQIFAGKNRLQLKLDSKSNYRVISRDRKVKLKDLSTGEKNIISLCYFFAQLRSNTNAYENFSDPYLIVLDDPISSLDFDNKVGIYTFLRTQIEHIIANNLNSRLIIFTHDLEVVYKMNRVLEDIKESTNLGKFYIFKRLDVDKKTHNMPVNKINSYAWNIDLIYKYANEDSDIIENADHYIGNILRKTLEAYSTFTYRSSISSITQNDDILSKIEDLDKRDYYRSRMYRLVLNSESHTEEIAKMFTDHELFEEFNPNERIETSKDVLCILYLLDPEHIKAYLPNDELKIRNIEGWIRNPTEQIL